MKTCKYYKEIILETFNNKQLWNYYWASESKIDGINIETIEGRKKFIRHYFDVAGKSGLIDEYIDFENFDGSRIKHIVYTFLLGIYFEELPIFKNLIDPEIQEMATYIQKSTIKFPFVWFLICLTHDLESPFEHTSVKEKDYKLIDDTIIPNHFNPVPTRLRCVYRSYFRYRALNGVRDHGIFGGVKAYKELCRIRKSQEAVQKKCGSQNKLNWDKELDIIYAYCSWIIICHNIWCKRSGVAQDLLDCHIYRQLGMKSIILKSKNDRLAIMLKNPLFFLFCLVDTIDPVKRVNEGDLCDINIECHDNEITIQSSRLDYLEGIRSINTWLTFGADAVVDNQLKLYLTQIK